MFDYLMKRKPFPLLNMGVDVDVVLGGCGVVPVAQEVMRRVRDLTKYQQIREAMGAQTFACKCMCRRFKKFLYIASIYIGSWHKL